VVQATCLVQTMVLSGGVTEWTERTPIVVREAEMVGTRWAGQASCCGWAWDGAWPG